MPLIIILLASMDIFAIYRDVAGRRVTDPAYDAHTLHIPADYMRKQTPGHKQWWMEKSKHFDAVIFFKVAQLVLMVNHICLA